MFKIRSVINEILWFLVLFIVVVVVVVVTVLIDVDVVIVVVDPKNLPLKSAQNRVSNR